MTNFDIKDCKTGSYTNDVFAKLSRALTIADINKMLSYEDIIKIQRVYMGVVAEHVEYVIKRLPYNARIYTQATRIENDKVVMIYLDDHLEIELIIMFDGRNFSLNCENIMKIDCDKDHRITVTDIQNTQHEIAKVIQKVFVALTKKEEC